MINIPSHFKLFENLKVCYTYLPMNSEKHFLKLGVFRFSVRNSSLICDPRNQPNFKGVSTSMAHLFQL